MGNYVKATNFTAKDTLPTGNSGKIIKGAEIDTELTAVASAVSSKADINSPTFTGTPAGPTASTGTNTTQLATTAFVIASMYPVGSIYINAGVSTNPATLLGFGTWEAFGAGKVLVGLDSADTLFDTLEETGGSKNSIVVSHTHTATVTDSGHSHTVDRKNSFSTSDEAYLTRGGGDVVTDYTTNTATTGITVANSTEGSSGTNANVQPFIVVKMWKRTA